PPQAPAHTHHTHRRASERSTAQLRAGGHGKAGAPRWWPRGSRGSVPVGGVVAYGLQWPARRASWGLCQAADGELQQPVRSLSLATSRTWAPAKTNGVERRRPDSPGLRPSPSNPLKPQHLPLPLDLPVTKQRRRQPLHQKDTAPLCFPNRTRMRAIRRQRGLRPAAGLDLPDGARSARPQTSLLSASGGGVASSSRRRVRLPAAGVASGRWRQRQAAASDRQQQLEAGGRVRKRGPRRSLYGQAAAPTRGGPGDVGGQRARGSAAVAGPGGGASTSTRPPRLRNLCHLLPGPSAGAAELLRSPQGLGHAVRR
ncbi:unnamed protein product, partial [Urochloa humidicola]